MQQLWQLGDIDRDAPRLVAGDELGQNRGGFLPLFRVIVFSMAVVICWMLAHPRLIGRESMRKFLIRERQKARSSRHGAGEAFLLMVALLSLSDVAVPQEMPTSGPDPSYNDLVVKYLKDTFKNLASYDAFAISAFRWVSSFKGWSWMTCVRFEENGHPRTYAVFIKDGAGH